jgi:hypothetical protein
MRVNITHMGLISVCIYCFVDKTVFQKEIYNSIPNVNAWRVLRKRLHLKTYKLAIVQGVIFAKILLLIP